jgi:hypothetical protein
MDKARLAPAGAWITSSSFRQTEHDFEICNCILIGRLLDDQWLRARGSHGANEQIFGAIQQNLKTTRSDYQPGNCAQQQEKESEDRYCCNVIGGLDGRID